MPLFDHVLAEYYRLNPGREGRPPHDALDLMPAFCNVLEACGVVKQRPTRAEYKMSVAGIAKNSIMFNLRRLVRKATR